MDQIWKILNRLRFALLGYAIGASMVQAVAIAVGGKLSVSWAFAICVVLVALSINEIHQEKIRDEEKQRTELLAAIVRRGFTMVDDEKGLVQ